MARRGTLRVSQRLFDAARELSCAAKKPVWGAGLPALAFAGAAAFSARRFPALVTSSSCLVSVHQKWRSVVNQAESVRPSESYHIQVVTGSVRGAGSPRPAVLQLFGENGESEPYLLGTEEGEERGFSSSSRKTYMIRAPNLGPLTRVAIRQVPSEEVPSETSSDDEDASGSSSDWYLERIVVVGPDGESWSFPFSNWVGRASSTSSMTGTFGQSLGSPEHTLVPSSVQLSSMRDPRYNYKFKPLKVTAAAFSIPHPDKVAEGVRGVNRRLEGYAGEDAYFIADTTAENGDEQPPTQNEGKGSNNHDDSSTGVIGLGVSDGVYAWRNKGVDAGAFSRALVTACREAVLGGAPDALSALRSASEAVKAAKTEGSATACLVLVDTRAGVMTTANLGDSGWMLLSPGSGSRGPAARRRPRALQERSPQQEHSFGYPFQLGSQESADNADDALVTAMPVLPGSTLILGSDGLFDNLDDARIVRLVDDMLDEGKRPAQVARAVAFAAWEASVDKEGDTPYSRAAREAFDLVFNGGKADDITALVAIIQ